MSIHRGARGQRTAGGWRVTHGASRPGGSPATHDSAPGPSTSSGRTERTTSPPWPRRPSSRSGRRACRQTSRPRSSYEGAPQLFPLPAGTRLTRIHSADFDVTGFNPTVARSDLRGGRFDSTPDDEYAFLYAAADDATAVSEALLRDLQIDDRGAALAPARSPFRTANQLAAHNAGPGAGGPSVRPGPGGGGSGHVVDTLIRRRIRDDAALGLGDSGVGALGPWHDVALASGARGVRLRLLLRPLPGRLLRGSDGPPPGAAWRPEPRCGAARLYVEEIPVRLLRDVLRCSSC